MSRAPPHTHPHWLQVPHGPCADAEGRERGQLLQALVVLRHPLQEAGHQGGGERPGVQAGARHRRLLGTQENGGAQVSQLLAQHAPPAAATCAGAGTNAGVHARVRQHKRTRCHKDSCNRLSQMRLCSPSGTALSPCVSALAWPMHDTHTHLCALPMAAIAADAARACVVPYSCAVLEARLRVLHAPGEAGGHSPAGSRHGLHVAEEGGGRRPPLATSIVWTASLCAFWGLRSGFPGLTGSILPSQSPPQLKVRHLRLQHLLALPGLPLPEPQVLVPFPLL